MMQHGSLFAGIGGIDLGFENSGIDTAWWVENDHDCQKILRTSFPEATGYDDIEQWKEWVDDLEEVDVISGGFPCQDISLAGPNRLGLKGKRSGLWFRFHDIIEAKLPQWVLVENVAGLLHSNQGRDLGTILGALEELGYEWAFRVLDARYFGVPQRRRRVFIVGHRGEGEGRAAWVLGLTGAEAKPPAPSFAVRRAARSLDVGPRSVVTLRMRAGKPGGGKGPLISEDSSLTIGTWHDQIVFVPRQRPRTFTATETERLFGFPDNWTAGFEDPIRIRMLGNAVVVPVAEWVGDRIRRAHEDRMD